MAGMYRSQEPVEPEPAPVVLPYKYWHPMCHKCGNTKVPKNSHCRSHTCPWCIECKPIIPRDAPR